MRTIAIIARKGGSGKTTASAHISLAGHLRGWRTLLVDTDPQKSATAIFESRKGSGPQLVAATGGELLSLQMSAVRSRIDLMIIDSPAGVEDEIAASVVLADLTILVVRPTFLDIAASIQSASIIRRLRKPGMILVNQAPVQRSEIEAPAVKRALEAMRLLRLPVIPHILRYRAGYQTAVEEGRSVEEAFPGSPAADEVAALWEYIERFALGQRRQNGDAQP